jgi:hypothetical protein
MAILAVCRFFSWSWHGVILAKGTDFGQLPTYKIGQFLAKINPVIGSPMRENGLWICES